MYIGQRDLQNRTYLAAKEAGDAAGGLGAVPSEEQFEQAASKYAVPVASVKERRFAMDAPKQDYVSSPSESRPNVVATVQKIEGHPKFVWQRADIAGPQANAQFIPGTRVSPLPRPEGVVFSEKAYALYEMRKPEIETLTQPKILTKRQAAQYYYSTGELPVYGGASVVSWKPQREEAVQLKPSLFTPSGEIHATTMSSMVEQPRFSLASTGFLIGKSYQASVLKSQYQPKPLDTTKGFFSMSQQTISNIIGEFKSEPIRTSASLGLNIISFSKFQKSGTIVWGGMMGYGVGSRMNSTGLGKAFQIEAATQAPYISAGLAFGTVHKSYSYMRPMEAKYELQFPATYTKKGLQADWSFMGSKRIWRWEAGKQTGSTRIKLDYIQPIKSAGSMTIYRRVESKAKLDTNALMHDLAGRNRGIVTLDKYVKPGKLVNIEDIPTLGRPVLKEQLGPAGTRLDLLQKYRSGYTYSRTFDMQKPIIDIMEVQRWNNPKKMIMIENLGYFQTSTVTKTINVPSSISFKPYSTTRSVLPFASKKVTLNTMSEFSEYGYGFISRIRNKPKARNDLGITLPSKNAKVGFSTKGKLFASDAENIYISLGKLKVPKADTKVIRLLNPDQYRRPLYSTAGISLAPLPKYPPAQTLKTAQPSTRKSADSSRMFSDVAPARGSRQYPLIVMEPEYYRNAKDIVGINLRDMSRGRFMQMPKLGTMNVGMISQKYRQADVSIQDYRSNRTVFNASIPVQMIRPAQTQRRRQEIVQRQIIMPFNIPMPKGRPSRGQPTFRPARIVPEFSLPKLKMSMDSTGKPFNLGIDNRHFRYTASIYRAQTGQYGPVPKILTGVSPRFLPISVRKPRRRKR